jgi:hypothetical protein
VEAALEDALKANRLVDTREPYEVPVSQTEAMAELEADNA